MLFHYYGHWMPDIAQKCLTHVMKTNVFITSVIPKIGFSATTYTRIFNNTLNERENHVDFVGNHENCVFPTIFPQIPHV